MKLQLGHSLLTLWAVFLQCTSQQTTSSTSSSQVSTKVHVETLLSRSQDNDSNLRNGDHSSRRRKAAESEDHVTLNSSRATVIPGRSQKSQRLRAEDGASPLCAYRVIEGGIGGHLCFRHSLPEYKCQKEHCRTVVSSGSFVAHILINGSVLLQWKQSPVKRQGNKTDGQSISKDQVLNATNPVTVVSGRSHRRGGFELSCWWNGSYTQFECTGVQLAQGCRDYLLMDLHENIPYRFCLRSLDRTRPQYGCVEFILPPSGMQDIVIAMTTVGGAICVMLVIICLLVAYITENIMSPTTTHTYSYRTHSCH